MIKVAHIENGFTDKFGIPRQSGRVENLSKIVFEKEFKSLDAIRRLGEFSHLWLIFGFTKADGKYSLTVRPPRLGGNEKVGVFASRSPFRPNNLGLSSVKLVKIEKDGSLIVSGADLLNGTPIYDIKPYLPFTDCHTDATSGYATEFVMYKLKVENTELLSGLPGEIAGDIIACLSEDPRPSYQEDCERVYAMDYSGVNVSFTVDNDTVKIIKVK
ncbi:MAG: tRNA (N6-threonylcarbamoyladenosine(37)-N6)-methyltransferase TrmO [Clostridia bacterium]|nr:tRNA (N6-threonylcarbamoyladenosine(37)-N6)-methyltransferase TrmO [Clostridia bacterium]